MIRSRIQIGSGAVYDAYDQYGFVYMDADERTAPDVQDFTTTKYVEEADEHLDPRTIETAFDYKVKFLVEAPDGNYKSVNNKIDDFNKLLYKRGENGVLTAQKVTFYNDLNRVKVVGYAKPISEPAEVFHTGSYGGSDYVVFELTIHVSNPSECVWATERYTDGMAEVAYNSTDAEAGVMWLSNTNLPLYLPDGTTKAVLFDHATIRHVTIPLNKGEAVEGMTQAFGNALHYVVADASGNALAYKQPRTDAYEPFAYISENSDTVYFTFNIRDSRSDYYAVAKRDAGSVRFEALDGTVGVMGANGAVESHNYLRMVTIPLRKGDSVAGNVRSFGNAPYWVIKDDTGRVTDSQAADEDVALPVTYTSTVAEGKVEYITFNLRENTNSYIVLTRAK